MSLDDVWVNVVTEFVHKPFGLQDRYFAQTAIPESYNAVLPRSSRPSQFVMGGVIEAPAGHRPDAASVVPLDMTPAQTGAPGFTHPNTSTVTYLPALGSSVGAGICQLYLDLHKQWHHPMTRIRKMKARTSSLSTFLSNKLNSLRSKLSGALHEVASALKIPHHKVDEACRSQVSQETPLTLEVGGGTVASYAFGGATEMVWYGLRCCCR